MRSPWRAVFIVLALAAVVPATPSSALPPGPPEVEVSTRWLGAAGSYEIEVVAHDPDGVIRTLDVCVEQSCLAQSSSYGPVDEALACLNGGSDEVTMTHTFPGPGVYEGLVTVTGGSCPGIGGDDTVEHPFTVTVRPPPAPIPCATQGAPSATDIGVTAESVTLAASLPVFGLGATDGRATTNGMQAAVSSINQTGGVCGRHVELRIADDGGDAERRRQYVADAIASDEVFALVGTDVGVAVSDLEAAGMPAVATPGATRAEFGSPWVWPVGAGNDAFGWIAVDEAYEQGARTFAVVYDATRPLGEETREAVEAAAAARGATVVATVPLVPGAVQYSAEVTAFNQACSEGCDAVVYALDPSTAQQWHQRGPTRARIRTSAHPSLFLRNYASSCGESCEGHVIWTDFQPLIGAASDDLSRMCEEVRAIDPTADCANRSVLLGYESVLLAAHAMGRAGTDLTRAGLRHVLDTQSFDLGYHGGPLSWFASRHANRWERGYAVVVLFRNFVGFRETGGWREDPR